jgi:hypothetical protein
MTCVAQFGGTTLRVGHLSASPVEPGAAHAEPVRPRQPGRRALDAGKALFCPGLIVLALAGLVAAAGTPGKSAAQGLAEEIVPIKTRNVGVLREGAAEQPRSEDDQVLVDGWPLYRTERGQEAFNDAMATLKATEGPAPAPAAFKGCAGLNCNLSLPPLSREGWIPPGRIWLSPSEYVLIVHSPRLAYGQSYRRRSHRDMQYFVFHEFHNGTRNTDAYDTISSHSGSVFVPFYMSKQAVDARGRRFVVVVQVAPHDVESIHASNMDSAGPGVEVAKNWSDALEPLQGLAGILVATIVKAAAPHLEVVNHRGSEGQPMLSAYERRLAALKARPGSPSVALPFVPAPVQRVAMAAARLDDLIARRRASAPIPIAARGVVPLTSAFVDSGVPTLIGPIRPAARPPIPPMPMLIGPIRPATRPPAPPEPRS